MIASITCFRMLPDQFAMSELSGEESAPRSTPWQSSRGRTLGRTTEEWAKIQTQAMRRVVAGAEDVWGSAGAGERCSLVLGAVGASGAEGF